MATKNSDGKNSLFKNIGKLDKNIPKWQVWLALISGIFLASVGVAYLLLPTHRSIFRTIISIIEIAYGVPLATNAVTRLRERGSK